MTATERDIAEAFFDSAEEERQQKGRYKDINFSSKVKRLDVESINKTADETAKFFFRDMFEDERKVIKEKLKDILITGVSGLNEADTAKIRSYEPTEEDIDDVIELLFAAEDVVIPGEADEQK